MFSLLGPVRSCINKWPTLLSPMCSQASSIFARTVRAYGTDHRDSFSGRIGKFDLKGKPSIIVPLGAKKVLVPSDKQAEIWRQKAALVEEYINLDPLEKQVVLMDLSIERFARSKGSPPLRGDSKEDINQLRLWVNSEAERSGVTPVTQYFPSNEGDSSKKIDVISSIVATINKCLAQEEFSAPAQVKSVSEYFWNTDQISEYMLPFASDSEELYTMVDMGLPLLDCSTLYHEVGIGSGEGILEIVRRGAQENRIPGCIVGTDINRYSLEALKLLVEDGFGGLDNVFLRHANAAEPIDMGQLGFSPNSFVLAANRFFSILDPSVFRSVVRSFSEQMQGNGYLVAGINTTSPENMELLEEFYRENPMYQVEDNELGKVVYRKNPFAKRMEAEGLNEKDLVKIIHKETGIPIEEIDISRIVRQVYYHPERFIDRIEKESFATLDTRIVKRNPSRLVALFKRNPS